MFSHGLKLRWGAIWTLVAELLREFVLVSGRLIIALDDTTYGKRLSTLKELAAEMQPGAQTGKIHINGKMRECKWSELVCVSKALKSEQASSRKHPTAKTSAFAFADVRRNIAAEMRRDTNFYIGCPETVKSAAKWIRGRIFGTAA